MTAGSNELFKDSVRMQDCTIRGFWFGTQLSPSWGLELSTRRSSTHFLLPDLGSLPPLQQGAWMEYAAMELITVRSFQFGQLQPYCLVGMGMANLNINVTDKAYRDTNRTSLVGGFGARYWLAGWFALRFDLRAHAAYLQERAQDPGNLDPGRWLRTQDLMFGVQVSLPSPAF